MKIPDATKSAESAGRPAQHDACGEGSIVNHKNTQRLWREEWLRVPRRRWRKYVGTSTTADAPTADAPNRVWATDFQFDATADGRPIKILSVIDSTPANASTGWSHAPSPARTSLPSSTAWPLSGAAIRPSFAVTTDPNWPVRQWRNRPATTSACTSSRQESRGEMAYVESFNSRVRDECLNINVFWSAAGFRADSICGDIHS